ncbi:MAG: DUF2115 domain-containing protein [Methanomicrobiales archaeon]|nr:DUF2115 domain-containing protein [Methanomicrobiales archaeon]
MPILEKTSPSTHPEELRRVATICDRLRGARTQGELGMQIAQAVTDCSLHDLQRIGGRLKREIDRLPSPYREAVRPYLTEQLFGSHHTLLTLYRAGAFHRMESPLADGDAATAYWRMVPAGCLSWDRAERDPDLRSPRLRFFYYLVCGFLMFVRDSPGHPVGTPFPGGFHVEERNRSYYCPIRNKEKDVEFSICTFCSTRQSDVP